MRSFPVKFMCVMRIFFDNILVRELTWFFCGCQMSVSLVCWRVKDMVPTACATPWSEWHC